MRVWKKWGVAVWLGALWLAGAQATELVGLAPYELASSGQQADAAATSYMQSSTAPSGALLEAVRWWGFHGPNSLGSDLDDFVVMLDGVVQSGTLTVRNATPFFDEYTLDVPDAALSATALSIVNDSLDVEWFWQGAAAGPNDPPDATAVAFSLIGRPGNLTVDEPVTPSLMLAAVAAMVLARRRRATPRRGPACARQR